MSPQTDRTGGSGPAPRGSGLGIAVIGLEFGAEFAALYAAHPDVDQVVVCDRDQDLVDRVRGRIGAAAVPSSDYEAVLAMSEVDAVHVVTGIPDHARHAIAALDAGKDVAVAVPLGLSVAELEAVLAARDRAGRICTMMETAVHTREFHLVRRLLAQGFFGEITLGRGVHMQDMSNWPGYWAGLPPMFYATHAVAPLLAALDSSATTVRALGGGRASDGPYGTSWPVQTALFEVAGSEAVLEVSRSLGRAARPYAEAFSLYGSEGSFEWPQLEETQSPWLFQAGTDTGARGRPVRIEQVEPDDTNVESLPVELRPFVHWHQAHGADGSTFGQGGGHGGSHPYLVDDFVSAVRDGHQPWIDHVRAAEWTAAGLAAHQSALVGGAAVPVPRFT